MSNTAVLRTATKAVETKLQSDRRADLMDILRRNGEYRTSTDPLLSALVRDRTVPLPDALYEQYDFLQCRCFLGLFPELHRAWITIDHQLFLWNYDSPDDFEVFDDQDQVIVSVGLVKPLPGVFLDEINYLLVVATPIEIILVAVAYNEKNPSNSLNLYRTDISIASDNVSMTSIVGTDEGRIFMCGSDGRLYELQYQAEDGWFTRKCRKVDLTATPYAMFIPTFLNFSGDDPIRKIVIDQSRNLLYTLSERSAIELFYLGADGKEFKRMYRAGDIFAQSQKWLEGCSIYPHPFIEPRTFQIISIHVIPSSESEVLHLMAVLSSGFRIYFQSHKVNPYSQEADRRPKREPNTFQIAHVRQPPANADRFRLHEANYVNGSLLAANAINEETDLICCFTSERTTHTELNGSSRIEGKTWSICESVVRNKPQSIAEEFMIDSRFVRKNIALTNAGVTIFTARRPIDILICLLENTLTSGGWPQGFSSFQSWFSPEQICAMCLAIIASNEYSLTSIIACATRLYMEVGGKPYLRQDSNQLRLSENNPLGQPLTTNEYVMSGRHDGLALYLARLLAPLWSSPIVNKTGKSSDLQWKHSHILLGSVSESLTAIDNLLTGNASLTAASNPNDIDYSSIGSSQVLGEKEAWQEETRSMRDMHALVKRCIEGISFLALLADFRFLSLSPSFEASLTKYLLEESFMNLVTMDWGREVAKKIFTKIVQVQIAQGVAITDLCDLAQSKCPTFCCVEDVVLFKGMELLTKAKSENGDMGRALLAEALNLFINILPSLNFAKVSELAAQFQSVSDYYGAVTLVLSFAQAEDPNSVAFPFFAEGRPANDYREVFFAKRQECYLLVKSLIMAADAPETGKEGAATAPDSSRLVNSFQADLVKHCLRFDDKLFHYFLFDWFMNERLNSTLLELDSVYLEDFLAMEPVELSRIDLLWRLYVRKEEFMKAAQVLRAIAVSKHSMPFIKRVEMLQLAAANAKSATVNVADHDFVRELEDKKDVALIQMEVFTASQKLGLLAPDDALFDSLLTISELYTGYTRPMNLHEISLLILHVSEHKDPQLVQQLWSKIVREVVDSSQISDMQKPVVLAEKVKALGHRYLHDDNVFPLVFLCTFLESTVFQNAAMRSPGGKDAESWVIHVMRSLGVSFAQLFEIYYEMLEARNAPWNTVAGEQHVTGRLVVLVTEWCEAVDASAAERARFQAKTVDDALSKMLLTAGGSRVLAGGSGGGGASSLQLQESLKQLQDRVRRSFL
ncbi:Nup133 N terminal like-domain-containing protein [Chytriomyces cf. hyalinus JEL632]|nr:Nup133 N terminal like-domain-containing protein [Chytriomyces cf. hyalinus JEL632]